MITDILGKLFQKQNLTFEEMQAAMGEIMEGKCTDAQIGAFLASLRCKGETPDEIAAAATILRSKATNISCSRQNIVDTCGTGGDHSGSFNISTAAAIVAAAAGVPVAKHGNKAMSSSCGSANVLQELGLNLDLTPEQVGESIDKHNIGFLFAMKLHGAMKYVGPARQELAQRTIFNILGPLINPAGARRQVLGVFDHTLIGKLAMVLKALGSEHVMVVAGSDGLDEITLTATTHIAELKNGDISEFELNAGDLGFTPCTKNDLKGGSAVENAGIIKSILQGEKGPRRDIVLLNAAAAIYVGDKAQNLKSGLKLAAEAIDSGAASNTLKNFIEFSQ